MGADWNDVTDGNNTAMVAYIANRLAQDGATVTRNQAIAELLLMAGINQAGTTSGPGIKNNGGRFV